MRSTRRTIRANRSNTPNAATMLAQGLTLAQEGKVDQAFLIVSQALVVDPGSAIGHNNLGLLYQKRGKLAEAVSSFRRALAINKDYKLAHTNLGAALAALNRHEEALEACDWALRIDPHYAPALHNAGVALATLGRYDAAVDRFTAALGIDGDLVAAKIGLAHALRDGERLAEAIDAYRAVVTSDSNNIEARLQLAKLLLRADDHEEALRCYEQILEVDPSSAEAWSERGRLLAEIGQMEKARESFRRAISIQPLNTHNHLFLVNNTRLREDDDDFKTLLVMGVHIPELPRSEQISAHFALGKALADVGRHDDGFGHIVQANALRRKGLDYDEPQTLRHLQRIKDISVAGHLALWPEGSSSETPIFIVGMPRSGSTLVEQILAAHPDVACVGESPALRGALKAHRVNPIGARPDGLPQIPDAETVQKVAATYLELTSKAATGGGGAGQHPARITDKMLNNFRYVGLINRLFPKARIIHTFRDPIESCLSSFRINFETQAFAFDLGELGRYYRAYAIMMRHWRRVLPANTIFDVRYEAVARDFETSAKAIVAHCGLPWNDACLRFHEADRPVKTASVEQVRRPIYQTSVRKWRPDAATLKPLLDGLGIADSNGQHAL